ncbi:MAG: carbamate kinase, partial [Candidatus Aminicenantaceae bacterium]
FMDPVEKISKKLAVVALGGNALLKKGEKGTTEEQEKNAAETSKQLYNMIERGYNLIITHGNGPQVGNILIRSEEAKEKVPESPLDVCVAESEGSIGYYLQQALLNTLRRARNKRFVVTVITQVLVDQNDPAFKNPTKPVGPFYTKEHAQILQKEKKWSMVEDSGRGYRRVVPSPIPKKIVQRYMIRDSAKRGHIVIAIGGGGIPIAKNRNGDYEGIEAVIDKDLASSLLACEIDADVFLILTEVEKVALNFNTPDQKDIDVMSIEDAEQFLKEGHFPPGSMGPKIQSAIEFAKTCNKEVIITSINKLSEALDGKTGTRIIPLE